MNCKPGQMAMIVRRSRFGSCSDHKIGRPVVVASLLHSPRVELSEGPIWLLEEPVGPCPHGVMGCPGVEAVPDLCLRPMGDEREIKHDILLEAIEDFH